MSSSCRALCIYCEVKSLYSGQIAKAATARRKVKRSSTGGRRRIAPISSWYQ